MTSTGMRIGRPSDAGRVTVRRPAPSGAPAGDRIARWLEEGAAGHGGLVRAAARTTAVGAVVVVPEYRRAASRAALSALAARTAPGQLVAVVGYGGRTRGRFAVEDAREVLHTAGARVLDLALGIDAARVRAGGFGDDDRVLRDLVLDDLAAALSGSG